MLKRIALTLIACLWASLAFGQANNSSTWQTPGNQTVPGIVNMLPNTAGVAVPDGNNIAPGTAIAAFASGTTTATSATLAASGTLNTYICGFHVETGTATAAITVTVTVTGLKGGTFTTSANAPVTAATATAGPILTQVFTPCIPSNAINTAIVVQASALGAGGVNQQVNAWGFQF